MDEAEPKLRLSQLCNSLIAEFMFAEYGPQSLQRMPGGYEYAHQGSPEYVDVKGVWRGNGKVEREGDKLV